MPIPFLTACWKNLIVINYEVSPEILTPHIPRGVELDFYNDKTFVSLVAFQFLRNKLFGVVPTFPAYSFEEINLRFYVRHKKGDEIRRGVVFVKEFVPSRLIANTARRFYEEPYETVPMFHDVRDFDSQQGGNVSYGLQKDNHMYAISANTYGARAMLAPGSIEEFILEHYWGYTARSDGSTSEYKVEHPPWKTWKMDYVNVDDGFATLYGKEFEPVLRKKPHSAFVADGSDVSVFQCSRHK